MPVPYATFRAALDAGNLDRVVLLAREMRSPMKLADALEVVLLLRGGNDSRYDRACVRWLGRFALEAREVSLEALREAASALDILPDHPEAAMGQLQRICVEHGVG